MVMPDPKKFEVDQKLLERLDGVTTAEVLSIIMEVREKTIEDCKHATGRLLENQAYALSNHVRETHKLSGDELGKQERRNIFFDAASEIITAALTEALVPSAHGMSPIDVVEKLLVDSLPSEEGKSD